MDGWRLLDRRGGGGGGVWCGSSHPEWIPGPWTLEGSPPSLPIVLQTPKTHPVCSNPGRVLVLQCCTYVLHVLYGCGHRSAFLPCQILPSMSYIVKSSCTKTKLMSSWVDIYHVCIQYPSSIEKAKPLRAFQPIILPRAHMYIHHTPLFWSFQNFHKYPCPYG
jgi:hypothetical protein